MAPQPGPRPDPRRRGRLGEAGSDAGRAARRGLSASGSRPSAEPLALVAGREFVQIPNAERPRLLVTLDDKAVRFALEHLGRETTAWRLARVMGRLGLGRALLAARFPVGVVTQHVGATPLLDELQRVTGEPGSFVVQVGREGDLLVHLLRGDTAAAVAKVSRDTVRLECEALALRDVGELARSAGADVPRPLAQHELNGVAVLVETAVRGRPLAWTLAGARRRLRPGLEAVAEWLAAWHHLTAAPARLTRDLLEAELLGPAGVVAAAIDDGDAYLRVLADAGARAEGAAVSLVAAHWDLTSSNVLAEGRRLGIVDWEHARTDSLPLTDFVYAAADLVSAVGRHEDRVGSFESCFAPGGRWAELVAGLERRLRDAVGISEIVAEVCFHACWARHASNELRASRGRPGEFVALARRAAELRR